MHLLAEALEYHVEHRDKEYAEGRGDQHAAEHRGSEPALARLARGADDDQRHESENEGEAGHQHRADAQARR